MTITRRVLTQKAMFSMAGLAAGSAWTGASGAGNGTLTFDRFACNMESWWLDYPFLQRFEKAAEAGFSAVEFWPFGEGERDPRRIGDLCRSLSLDVQQFTAWGAPSLADTAHHSAFLEAIKAAIDVAHELEAPMFTVVGHQTVGGIDHRNSLTNLRRALESAAPLLESAGKVAILEPFNPVDHQGHFLNGSADGLSICREIDSPGIKLNWDLYHMQLSEGNLLANFDAGFDQIAYIQVADVPGRHQPGTGEINYRKVFSAIMNSGYDGRIGLECWPLTGGQLAVGRSVDDPLDQSAVDPGQNPRQADNNNDEQRAIADLLNLIA